MLDLQDSRLYQVSLVGALNLSAQLDLKMDADDAGFKQTVCTNGAIAVAAGSGVAYTPMGRLFSVEMPFKRPRPVILQRFKRVPKKRLQAA